MKGRPVLGAIAGLFFGLFVAVDLQQFSVRPLDSLSLFGLPALGLVVGILFAAWAPFGRKRAGQTSSAADDSPGSETSGA